MKSISCLFSLVTILTFLVACGENKPCVLAPQNTPMAMDNDEMSHGNRVLDPDFEGDINLWSNVEVCGEVVEGIGRNGSRGFVYRRANAEDYQILRQRITLVPGRRYQFRAWCCPAEGRESLSGCGVVLEFSRGGVYLGTQYMDSTPEEDTNWELYHTEFTAGEEGTSYSLAIFLIPGETGAFVVDNIEIVELATRWRFAQLLPWGATAQPGDELIFASIFPDIPCEEQSITLNFQRDGQSVEETQLVPQANGAMKCLLPSSWASGDYRILATLKDAQGIKRGTAELPLKVVSERRRTVEVVPNGSLLVEDNPFYPIGAFSNGHFTNTEHAEMAELGFNCSLAYPMIADWSKLEEIDDYIRELDNCQRLGLKVIFCLAYHFKKLADDLETFQKLVAPWVERVKDHPALLAYYLMDEPPADKAQLAAECRQWLNTIDPNHPVIAVFCNRMGVNDFLAGVDVVSEDIYPFATNEHSVKRQLMPLKELRGQELPLWLCAQSYDKGNVIATDHYYPTAMEILAQGVTAYISDAGGLLYWCYYHIKRAGEPERRLSEMKWAVALLKDVAPFALAEQPAEPPAWLAEAQAKDVAWRIFANGQGEYRLLVVSTDTPGRLSVELPEGLEFAGSATGLTAAGGRTLLFQGKSLPDCDIIKLQRK